MENFITRQQRFLQQLSNNAVAILFAAKDTGEGTYPFRQNSDFYYLTGFNEPDAVAVFIPGRKEGDYILFSAKHDKEKELWYGKKIGQEDAVKIYGAKQAFSLEELNNRLPELLKNKQTIHCDLHNQADMQQTLAWLQQATLESRTGVNPPSQLINASEIIHEMRLIKDASEIELLRQAAEITAKAQLSAMKVCRPGMMECELEAAVKHEFIKHGARTPSFQPIIAGGGNACCLHYSENNTKLKDGDLVLVDIGAEYDHYAGDLTRTFPINGRFTEEQKQIYQAVLDVEEAIIAEIKPGVAWKQLHDLSVKLITAALKKLGLIKRDEDYKNFYMHKIGHFIGIDCHDVGKYKCKDTWRVLEAGMLLTVEPGIYVAEKGIGVRIEDDILVTEHGCEVLSNMVPKTINEIENIMGK